MEKAKKERATAKRLFTFSVKSIETMIKSTPTKTQLEKAFEKYESAYDDLVCANEEVIKLLPEDCQETELQQNINYLSEVNSERAQLTVAVQDLLKFIEKEKPLIKPEGECSSTIPIVHRKSQLERLKIQHFNENIREYPGWKILFLSSMDKYCQDNEEKLQRLKEAVLPPVKKEIQHCLTVESAMNILDQNYGNCDDLMLLLLTDIKSYKSLKNGSAQSFKLYASEIRSFITRMTDLGKEHDLKADYIVIDLIDKLLPEDCYKYKSYCFNNNRPKTLETLVSWLCDEAHLRIGLIDEKTYKSYSASHSVSVKPQSKIVKPCLLKCNLSHMLKDCPVFFAMKVPDRWEIVKNNRCCFCCLKQFHQTKNCYQKKLCDKLGCEKTHNILLHEDASHYSQANSSTSMTNNYGCGHLPVLKVNVYDDFGVAHEAIAMIDSGSQQSLIRKKFANKLRLKGGQQKDIHVKLAGGCEMTERSKNYVINISSIFKNNSQVYNLHVNSLETVCGDISPIDKQDLSKYSHLSGLVNYIYCNGGQVDVLIGTNFPTAFKELGSCCTSDEKAPIAKQTPLGWVLLGELGQQSNVTHVNQISILDEPNIAKFFEIDSLGVKPTKQCTCTDTELMESAFIDSVKKNTTLLPDGRIQMKMPWKKGHPTLPDSRRMAMKRLESLENKLLRTGKVDEYSAEIKKIVDDGFCIQLANENVDWTKPYWILPHRAVERPDASSTKLRIVFDSAATVDDICLNDALEKGPNYLNDLFKVLIGWRKDQVAYCGDIRKMFNMISIHPDDQPYHRFFWRDCNTSVEPTVYQWVRLSFGDKSSPDLACSGIHFLAERYAVDYPFAKADLLNHIYMDDIANSTPDTLSALQTINQVDSVLGKGCFTIKAWHSNAFEIDQAPDEKIISVLGHSWNKENDCFCLKNQALNVPEILTKRIIFGIVAQCWDPIGLIAPSMIRYKIEMQNLWSKGFTWDESLPKHVTVKWKDLISELPDVLKYETSRCLKPIDSVGPPQLHGFSDGGEYGYGSCLFLRWMLLDGSVKCRFVAGKAFVAPLKRKTISRLELMGCVTLSRLVDTVMSSLGFKFEKVFLWSDYLTALAWIRSLPRSFKPFVGVRIAEIQESHDPVLWRYVPSALNPADSMTKGIRSDHLEEWHRGPEFLTFPEEEWPILEHNVKQSVKDDPERKPIKITAVLQNDNIMNSFINKSLQWSKIVRLVALWLRFIRNCRPGIKMFGSLKSEELDNAKSCILTKMQIGFDPTNKNLIGLQSFLDKDGIWRAKGRLENAQNLPYDIRHPIILPKQSVLVRVMLEDLHRKLGHPGYKRLVDEVRQKYWIIGVRDIARSIYFNCLICKRRRNPLLCQQMGPLPDFRADFNTPSFANTSVDLFGPLKVKIGRKTIDKGYGCIFTCLTIRAIHVELVMEESTDHFLMALRRFAAIRGWPKLMFSDKGGNFIGSQTYLREMIENWNLNQIQHECIENQTKFDWKFNCPTASHMNGAVESLIKSVRKSIDCVFGFSCYTQSQWATILYEVGYLINSRPLYPSSDNILDAPPITPNSLLLGNNIIVPQPDRQDVVNPRHLNNSVQHKIQLFWEQWIRHFAPNLVARNKWFHSRDNLEVGDLCILLDSHLPRALWKLALVEEVYPSTDGHVRKVKIKTASGQYDRPIHKLCLIATKAELSATQIRTNP